MNKTLAICTIALVAGIMIIGSFAPIAVADKGGEPNEGNNGNNGCDKSNAKSKACEKNPNTDPEVPCEPHLCEL